MEPFTRALLDRAKGLVGGVLRAVHYDDSSAVESKSASATHVAVELGFDEETVRVVSSDEFTDGTFELALHVGPVPDHPRDDDITLTTDALQWAELVGHRIVSSKIHWVESPFVALTKRRRAFSSHHYDADGAVPFSGPQAPLALELHFANGGRLLLVSGSWTGVDSAIVETGAGINVLWDASTFATQVPRIAKDLKRTW